MARITKSILNSTYKSCRWNLCSYVSIFWLGTKLSPSHHCLVKWLIALRPYRLTIKPFLSTKQSYSGSKIILKENDSIISDSYKVADIFNMYYKSIAEYKFQDDGLHNLDFDNAIAKHASHTSISLIKQSISVNYEFSFSPISVQSMSKYISLLKSNKAVGHDGLHAAFLKCSGDNMSASLCNVFNASISSCGFPSSLKWADINPKYKKKDNLCKENYRSVNVLAVVSKVFERILSDQLMAYFVSILSHSLSAYRAGYNCQHVILQLTEFCQRPLIACHTDF